MATMIIIEERGKCQIHATSYNQNYATLCGLDGDDDDPAVAQITIGIAPTGSKINCRECIDIIIHASTYKAGKDF